ncbi:hypothetical protein AB0I81_03250 [Nonomuraea sp. NPDC050404]|uniref:phosphotransferase enzyme family protein n=1 Tax=Nonomuraea sp. NPDC050404 TaxID=3155783 RepID=UPI0033ED28BC
MIAEGAAAARAASFVGREYGVVPSAVAAGGAGVEAEVWRVGRERASPLCLKWFRGPADRALVERTILMDRLARRGLPFPRVHRTRSGEVVSALEGRAVVVVDWLDGGILDEFGAASAGAAGAVLAETHGVLAERRVPAPASPPPWRTADVEEAVERCRSLRGRIRRLKERSALDDRIDEALAARITDLRRARELRAGLPESSLELLHFDYTRPNLLFQGSRLTGVLDLQGIPGYAVWELGKIAFEPRTVASRHDWLKVALAAISAYQARRGRADVAAVARMTILYNLFSLWGVWDRYDGGDRAVPTAHEDYWLNRQTCASVLLRSLEEVETAVRGC